MEGFVVGYVGELAIVVVSAASDDSERSQRLFYRVDLAKRYQLIHRFANYNQATVDYWQQPKCKL